MYPLHPEPFLLPAFSPHPSKSSQSTRTGYLFYIAVFYIVVLVTQSCLTPCDPMDCSLPGSSVHGILQARILEWVAMPSSRGSSWPRDLTWISCIAGRFFNLRATGKSSILHIVKYTFQCYSLKSSYSFLLPWHWHLRKICNRSGNKTKVIRIPWFPIVDILFDTIIDIWQVS